MSTDTFLIKKNWENILQKFYNQQFAHIMGSDFEGQIINQTILLVHRTTGELIQIIPEKKSILLRHGHGQLSFHHREPEEMEDIIMDTSLGEALEILEKNWNFKRKVLNPDENPYP